MEQKRKSSQAAAAGKSKETEEETTASKGYRGETKGRKLGKQGGGEKFERAQTGWDVGTVIAKDILA